MQLSPAMRAHELRLGRPLADVLIDEYSDAPLERIAADFDVSEKTIARWLDRLGIKRRLVLVHPHDGEAPCTGSHPPSEGAAVTPEVEA